MDFALLMSPNDFDFIVNCCLFLGVKVKMEKSKVKQILLFIRV